MLFSHYYLAVPAGIEPTLAESKSAVLPLHQGTLILVVAVRFELTKHEAEDLQSSGFNHSPKQPYSLFIQFLDH